MAKANLKIGERPAGGTTAVMTYSGGVSPDGVWDCSGNVWEWTSSWWDERRTYRVLRGGSWITVNERFARCSYRDVAPPSLFGDSGGFRILVSACSP